MMTLVTLVAALAAAHPLSPLSAAFTETAQGAYEVRFQRSTTVAPAVALDLPPGCSGGAETATTEGDLLVGRSVWRCDGDLEGRAVHVAGLTEVALPCLVTVIRRDGTRVQGLLTPSDPWWTVPAAPSDGQVFVDGLALGVRHLLSGLDHVLFIAGLMLLVHGVRRRVVTLTAFTVGHSLTLSLAALTSWTPPIGPVEVGIALSLIVVALEVVQPTRPPERHSPWIAGGFGLLHGLGFIGALRGAGLPASAVPVTLAGFNLGVEVGQLIVVAAMVPLGWGMSRLGDAKLALGRRAAGYVLGALAAMWLLQRVADWARV